MYITNAIFRTVAQSKYSTLIAEARLTILDRLVCFSFKWFALSQIQFRDGFDTKKQRKMTQEYREIRRLNIK